MEMEDLFTKNSATEFEKRNIVKTIEGLQKHQSHNGVQFDGLKRLSLLTSDFSDCENPQKIMNDCIEVALVAMQTHPQDPKVVMYGCCVIGNVYNFLEEMIDIKIPKDITKKVINTVHSFLTAHASNLGGNIEFALTTEAQCYLCYALSAIGTTMTEEMKEWIEKKEGLIAIAKLIYKYQEDSFFLLNALSVFVNISEVENYKGIAKSVIQTEKIQQVLESPSVVDCSDEGLQGILEEWNEIFNK